MVGKGVKISFYAGCAVLRLVAQSCLNLYNPMDRSPPGSSVHGYSPCKTLEWIAMPSSRRSSQPRDRSQVSHIAGDSLPAELPGKPQFPPQFTSVQLLSRVWLFATPWITARQASLSITNSRRSLRLASIKSVMPSSHPSSVVPFSSCPQSLPASESFPMSQLFTWGGQNIGVSALSSFLPKNTQVWSPLGWTGWISLQSKGLSRVFSNTTVQKHQFFSTQLSSQSNSHIHTWPLEKP